MRRSLAALLLSAFLASAIAQAPSIGITQVTVTWAAPTAYEPAIGVVTSLEVASAPTGILTAGTYELYLTQSSDPSALGLEANLTVASGVLTASVVSGGYGYEIGDVLTVPAGELPGATGPTLLEVTGVTTLPAQSLSASDVDHYTIWWGPSDGPGYCYASNCVRGPYGEAQVEAGTTSYTIAGACGDLSIEVFVATGATALIPFAVSEASMITFSTGEACPVPGAPGAPKLSWPKA